MPTLRILFAGNSITNGKLGESFVHRISISYPAYQIKNIGKDGDTYNLIIKRLKDFLARDNLYDFVFLQGGYNDLLLPTFKYKGSLFRFAYNQIKNDHIRLQTNH